MILAHFLNLPTLVNMWLSTIHKICLSGLQTISPVLVVVSACAAASPDEILLKDYKPRSIFKIPESRVEKPRYPIIDAHSHDYARSDADIKRWVETMDAVGIARTIILSGAIGQRFDEIQARYGKYPRRFEVWCGVDYSGFRDPG